MDAKQAALCAGISAAVTLTILFVAVRWGLPVVDRSAVITSGSNGT